MGVIMVFPLIKDIILSLTPVVENQQIKNDDFLLEFVLLAFKINFHVCLHYKSSKMKMVVSICTKDFFKLTISVLTPKEQLIDSYKIMVFRDFFIHDMFKIR